MMKRPVARLPVFVIPLVTTLLGLVVGVALVYIATLIERRGTWDQLDPPPGDILRIVAAEQHGLALLFTGRRHFRH